MRRAARRATTLALFVATLVAAGCGRPSVQGPPASPTTTSSSTTEPTTTAELSSSEQGEDHDHAQADGVRALTPERREALGLPSAIHPPEVLPALIEVQWGDPEAVAARYVLVDTNLSAADDPSAVNARRAEYAADRLQADLVASSSASAGIDDLRRQGAELHGEILGLTTSERSDDSAAVTLMVRRTVTVDGQLTGAARVGFYRITLVRISSEGRWLVVRVELS